MKKTHPFHLVDRSPWPIYAALASLTLVVGLVASMHGYSGGFILFLVGVVDVLMVAAFWWRDVIRESTYGGFHTRPVQRGGSYNFTFVVMFKQLVFFFWFTICQRYTPKKLNIDLISTVLGDFFLNFSSFEVFFSVIISSIVIRRYIDLFMFFLRSLGFICQLFLTYEFWSTPLLIILLDGTVCSSFAQPFLVLGLLVVFLVLFLDFKHLRVKSTRSIFHKLLAIFVTANGILSLVLVVQQFFFPHLVSPTFFSCRLAVIVSSSNFYSNVNFYESTVNSFSRFYSYGALNYYDLAVLSQSQIFFKISPHDDTWFNWFTHLSPVSVTGTVTMIIVFLTLFVHFLLLPWGARNKNLKFLFFNFFFLNEFYFDFFNDKFIYLLFFFIIFSGLLKIILKKII